MIPRQVAEELGQPLPLFIKWDDADYGLRAGRARLRHRHAARRRDLAHGVERQGRRHRLAGVLPPAQPAGGRRHALGRQRQRAAWPSLKATIKHLLCLEYSTVAIQNKAMDDFLAGPEHIFSILESALPDVRKMREQFPDAVVLPGATALPPPSDKRRKKVKIPTNPPRDRVPARPRRASPTQAARPRASSAPAAQRGDPGRAVVLAVQGRRRHRHHRRRPRRGLPAA